MTGSVALVGAGPGHPGLLTLRGRECLEQATVVVHDRLIPAEVLRFAHDSARRIYVGKGPRQHAVPQDGINALLVELAQSGQRVVRLKGGDPFVFGRGGEEALTLREHGIPFEIVPGVSSALAAPAFAGIPVTQRGVAASFTVLTGHEDPTKPESAHRWEALARGADTLVVLMGVEQLGDVAARLVAGGRPADEPAALVHWGSTPRQIVVQSTLGSIAEKARARGVKPPAVLVVGNVVALRERLAWFEHLPLFGLRPLVTRARAQASTFVQELRALGAQPLEQPAIEIHPLANFDALDAALSTLASANWVIFTSANGARAALERLLTTGRDARAFGAARLCAIGPATNDALRQYGLQADLVPAEYVSSAIVSALESAAIRGRRILLFRADIAPPKLAEALQARGADVESVAAYRTEPSAERGQALREALDRGDIDVLTFTSSSTVRNLIDAIGGTYLDIVRRLPSVCIGPVTAATAREGGLNVVAVATEHTVKGLVDTLNTWNAGQRAVSGGCP